jgi:phosphoribosylaminoimidazolecarboxamide formyltransferase/IMP cyclohydrolase
VRSLPFRDEVGNVERTNARIAFIEGEMTDPERNSWLKLFKSDPGELSLEEKSESISKMQEVCLSSDAFLPFRDNLDQASRRGVRYVVQPGGSLRDDLLIKAADEYGMLMAFSGIRLFHH